jgi:hypothetical protein
MAIVYRDWPYSLFFCIRYRERIVGITAPPMFTAKIVAGHSFARGMICRIPKKSK